MIAGAALALKGLTCASVYGMAAGVRSASREHPLGLPRFGSPFSAAWAEKRQWHHVRPIDSQRRAPGRAGAEQPARQSGSQRDEPLLEIGAGRERATEQ